MSGPLRYQITCDMILRVSLLAGDARLISNEEE